VIVLSSALLPTLSRRRHARSCDGNKVLVSYILQDIDENWVSVLQDLYVADLCVGAFRRLEECVRSMTASMEAGAYDIEIVRSVDALPRGFDFDAFARFLHECLKPYEDSMGDIRSSLSFVFSETTHPRGFFALATNADTHELVGGAVVHFTPWHGYVPNNLLLYLAVDPHYRNRGMGRDLLEAVIDACEGEIKLHVEHDNPARRLYERVGFTSKYAEMRLTQ
jgi:GNAT superfamily N-acetyltransferase